MTIYAMAGTKGGGGKSTLAVNLACELLARGGRVLLVDADPQQTAVTWSVAAQTAQQPAPTVAYVHPETITQQIPSLAQGYDHVVIDTAGRMDAGQRGALLVSDIVVYPLAPSVVDLWALAEPVKTLAEVRMMQEAAGAYVVKAVAVVNRRQSGTVVAKQVEEAALEMGLPIIGALNHRVAYAEAFAAGTNVVGYAPKSAAAKEVRTLVDALVAEVNEVQAVA